MEKYLDARIIDDYLVKKPFVRVTPDYHGGFDGILTSGDKYESVPDDIVGGRMVTQGDFIRELHPTGHKINSEQFYPDIWKKNEDGRPVVELVTRVAFPFQQIIATKQLIHLTGNPIKLEDSTMKPPTENKETLTFLRQGWKDKNMEITFFNFVNSVKTTGDGAVCFFFHDGKVKSRVFSYLEGDTLYMHRDPLTGEKMLFIRKYSMYDENNKETMEYAEAWDSHYMYRFQKRRSGLKGFTNSIKNIFNKSGWEEVSRGRHGFPTMPISYHREKDVCWADSQNNIDIYELAVSQLCENNKAYAFPILFVKGADLDFKGQVDGRPYAIMSADSDADAKTINRGESSQAFKLQLDVLLQNIFMGSFAVLPPEVKSGDLPGVAVKLLYSPAVEKAIKDAKILDHVVDDMVRLFKYGYAMESKKVSAFNKLNVHGTIEPYVHQNVAEVMQNLFTGVTAGFLSKETASEVAPYGKNDENDRLLNQVRDEILNLQNEEYDNHKSDGARPSENKRAGEGNPRD